jgi:3-dehydroquinate synthase class II
MGLREPEPDTREWYHVAGTFDGTTIRCYLNVVETDTNLLSAIKSGNATLFIGQDGWDNIFNGVVDEVKIYNRALTTDKIQADYEAGLNGTANTLSGTVTSPDLKGIANATVTLTTVEGTEINTTQTDSSGNYAFAGVDAGYYDITATKCSYWPNTNNVTVTAEAPTTANIVLCQKGDLNTNSEPADAGDLAMMADATKAGTSDGTYDLDGDGNPANEADLTLLKDVSVGVAVLE